MVTNKVRRAIRVNRDRASRAKIRVRGRAKSNNGSSSSRDNNMVIKSVHNNKH